ncbi:MAG: bifunctional 4-hydroxy-3-methylbut-2-enyl diphosphate reductase/30S ribosomal protein S1 [Christensenellales bacterium]
MTIQVAEKGGFCVGVRRAVDLAFHEAKSPGLYTLGSIIHNPQVVDKLRSKGVSEVEDISLVPDGGRIVIRSHGAGPEVFAYCKRHNITVIDATCPFVSRIQQKVAEACQQDSLILLVGESEHPEVKALFRWSGGTAEILQSLEDAEGLPGSEKKTLICAQTTTSLILWKQLLPIVQAKYSNCDVFNSICSVTEARQKEADYLSRHCDCMLVIGGRNSANTRELYHICRRNCSEVYWIETGEDLPRGWKPSNQVVGITSGASTPDWIIKEVIITMNDIENNAVPNPKSEDAVITTAAEIQEEKPAAPATEAAPAISDNDTVQSIPSAGDASGEANFAQDFEKMMMPIRAGKIIRGKVVSVNENEVCVNIGYKADGFIHRSEFSANGDVDPTTIVKEGDEIEVEVLKVNDGEGNVLLSKKNVDSRKHWRAILEANEKGEHFIAIGKQKVKGGLIATINGFRAFIPASHLDIRFVDDADFFVGQEMEVKIIEIDKARKRVVASRKEAIRENNEKERAAKWEKLQEGITVMGIVRRITDFGAFVDIGGIDGLVHVTNLAWGRVQNPKDVVSIGQEIEVLVLKVDRERQRVSLGYKQLRPKPWDVATSKYIPGTIVAGKIVRIVTFGAFVELEPGLDGLVHISQIADHRVNKIEDVLSVGEIVNVRILDVNPAERRISLSIRDAQIPESENDYYSDDYDDADYDQEDASLIDKIDDSLDA